MQSQICKGNISQDSQQSEIHKQNSFKMETANLKVKGNIINFLRTSKKLLKLELMNAFGRRH